MTATRPALRTTRGTALSLAGLLLLALTACGGGGSGGDSAATSDEGSVPSFAAHSGAGGSAGRGAAIPRPADGVAAGSKAGGSLNDTAPQQPAVISTGDVQLRSGDVAKAGFDVHKVVDLYHGTVEQDATETDGRGRPVRSRMVVRVPAASFDRAMTDLGKVGTLLASSSDSKDVTTQVLDNTVRVQVAKRSINRISVLLDQAATIHDVISIESELAARQADLASLEKQQRYLADQTSMSTITVSIERIPADAKPATHHSHRGFAAGLAGGWHALRGFAVVLATVSGALLPWVVLLALLAIPGWPLLRRARRRAAASPTAGA